MSIEEPTSTEGRGRFVLSVVFAVVVVLMMLWLIGTFQRKVPADAAAAKARPAAGVPLVKVRKLTVPAVEAAVGTITPVYESEIASKVLGRVVEVTMKAGQ